VITKLIFNSEWKKGRPTRNGCVIQKQTSAGTVDYRRGAKIRPKGLNQKAQVLNRPKRRSLSPETYWSLANK